MLRRGFSPSWVYSLLIFPTITRSRGGCGAAAESQSFWLHPQHIETLLSQYFSEVSTKAPEDGDGLLLEEEQGVGVGVWGHSRVSSDVEVVAVIAVGVVYVSTTSLFFLMGPPLRLLVALSVAYFLFLLACLLSLIRRVTWHQAWPPWQLCLKTSESPRTLQLLPTCGHRICK